MRQTLRPSLHGLLDYVTVVLFAAAPGMFGLVGAAAGISYGLAVVHFLLTVTTDFSAAIMRVVPLKVHGFIELVVSLVLVVLGLAVFSDVAAERNFYLVAGLVIFVVWFVSDYSDQPLSSADNSDTTIE